MPIHKGLIPREGFCADVVLRLIRQTILNPALLLPLVLLARFTRNGRNLSILHRKASSRLNKLFLIALVRGVSNWWSDKARNNWVDDDYDWSKEIVLITGGADGIGGRMVKLLSERGITVVVLDTRPLSFTASSKVHYFNCDLRSPENVAAKAEKIRVQVGHPTILINNAGVAFGQTVLDTQPEDLRFTFDVNVLAHYWTVQTFLPRMITNNHGMVVTMGSCVSLASVPNMVDYGASKAAALAFHEGLTAELASRYQAPKVRTVMVHPGTTKTNLAAGYEQATGFLAPKLDPESISEAVVKQILTGRSGKVILPEAGRFVVSALDVLPDWYAVPLRANAQSCMINSRGGRQEIEDVNAAYSNDGVRKSQDDTSESIVLVSGV